MSLAQAWKTYDRALIAGEKSELTRTTYGRYINRFIAFLEDEGVREPKVSELRTERVREFIAWLKAQPPAVVHGRVMAKGPTSIRAHVVALKTFAHFLLQNDVFKVDPVARLANPKIPAVDVKPFTRDEMRLLVAAIGTGPWATRNRAIVFFTVSAGCRAAEVCGLDVARLDLRERTATVLGKGNKQRTVVFDKLTAKYLAMWLGERPEGPAGGGRVFLTGTGRPLTTNGLYHVIRGLGDRAGVVGAHPHRLRHTMATTFLEAYPGQVFQLQTLLGHSQLEMTKRYVKAADVRRIVSGPTIVEVLGLR